jgi:hypothetical protein
MTQAQKPPANPVRFTSAHQAGWGRGSGRRAMAVDPGPGQDASAHGLNAVPPPGGVLARPVGRTDEGTGDVRHQVRLVVRRSLD